ncbi:hypothetical protein F4V47_06990 [Lactococcus garvieae subsp. garvieae]|uniref:hypothetical protein n=1 Tax=Lactococcus garvieae TaxID=1363 RepID=UPI0005A9A88F|nr:hypothetical protein [Lactococcus garvieae]KAA8712124.1 hypothetical protein F4V47_06990 [Lactococcus garvieae subsp. garvieae]QPR48048.1 hypothetical protein I6G86_00080 [Lactococcus garvieae]QPR49292.1 hypothetical protein I6G86_02145 [Lactococcus garvieae]
MRKIIRKTIKSCFRVILGIIIFGVLLSISGPLIQYSCPKLLAHFITLAIGMGILLEIDIFKPTN